MPLLRELGHEPVAWLMPRRTGGHEGRFRPGGRSPTARLPTESAFSSRRTSGRSRPCCAGWSPMSCSAGVSLEAAAGGARCASARLRQPAPGQLPRHRGPIPLAWALREGDGEFGVTWHRMDAELDTGPILAQTTVPIEDDDTTIEQIGPKLTQASFGLLPRVFERLAAGDPGDPQTTREPPGRALRRGLRDRRLDAAGPEDPRPGARLAAHVRHVRGDQGRSRSWTASGSSSCARASPTRATEPRPSSAARGPSGSSSPSRPSSFRLASCNTGGEMQ